MPGKRFVMAGGGTGGHIIPGLAVARELRSRGHEVVFVGTERGLESKLVPAEGFTLEKISIGGLNRVGLRQKAATLVQLPLATLRCRKFVRPAAAVFSMGGYVAGPPVMAALLSGRPVVVMEPNAVPGFTNRVISRFVSRALINFPDTASFFPHADLTGVPVREEFFRIPAKPRGEVLNLMITGGSQGALNLNIAAEQLWSQFMQNRIPVRILHQAGKARAEAISSRFEHTGLAGEVVPFITDMPAAFAEADLVISRSGASTVSELAAAGRPSILVPYPYAADDHQTRNAEAMERSGAARMVRDADLDGTKLFALIQELTSTDALERMGRAARQFARPGAASRAACILEEVACS
jgi:UDP-N-acetylglucosamine--N-acetylmuramyl-(pentapeptide) pyrophosphoryl-undecaprenol N-acetylglucosamine transferase